MAIFGVLFRAALAVGSIAFGALKAAYNQAAKTSGGSAGAGAFGQKLSITKTQPMTIAEAQKILGLPKLAEGETIDYGLVQDRFEKMFINNSVKNGGSFYLQSKIIRAKQCIEYELLKENKLNNEDQGSYEARTKSVVEQHTTENQSV
ncbi:hypothetical protein C9374_003016 [Naegleria lovaniensis]|uniref:Presequence translocated-associated motor subunit PAM16 n=1 Tax=Naegleria lovaniensis TaxID=51637 RepID=A0AA88GND3_NAELO|nr:uncharacterized protein C9374_003016 [Naegleria lovaniensis]KAG2385867.1 hypothetical protein C9374_003016 [Naegleria lovaniensis]